MSPKIKKILAPLIVIATIAGFTLYIKSHPQVIDRLGETPPTTALAVAALYGGWLIALMGVLYGGLALYNRRLNTEENFYVNAYSSIINFFGPGQSGPAVRAAYLKLKHGVTVKQYTFSTLLYYGFYALFSGSIIAVAALPWWLGILFVVFGTSACLAVIFLLKRKKATLFTGSQGQSVLPALGIIAAFTLLQIALQATIYFIELHSVGSSASVSQTLIYTGSANFALFVALTPGAIGFREGFLLFTQRLHHISNDTIVAANVLDRAVYIGFLGLLFLVILALRTRTRFAKLQSALNAKQD